MQQTHYHNKNRKPYESPYKNGRLPNQNRQAAIFIWGFSDFVATEKVSAHHPMSYTPCGFLVHPS